jgi:hypothetical protein
MPQRFGTGGSVGLLLSLGLSACTTLVTSGQHGTATEYTQRCVSTAVKAGRSSSGSSGFVAHNQIVPSPLTSSHFSPHAVRVAEVVGVLGIINDLSQSTTPSPGERIDRLARRQQLSDRILLSLLEIASTTAEVVCERDRADQLADRIDEIDGSRVKQLTIASIIIGGVASIISGGVGLAGGISTAGEAADIAGGALASWFGVSALFAHSEVDFRHDRNILKELWEDPQQTDIFSPIVWRYLHRTPDSQAGSPREEILNAWRQKGRLGEEGSDDETKRRNLFFGAGGRYASPELRARASMLETLEASLRLMHEDLEILVLEVLRLEEA